MARKNLLEGLMAEGARPAETAPGAKRPLKGAIGAVSQSIEALKARALLDIDPFLIDAGGLQDRLETDDAEDAALLASIRDYGQQVPVLVRPHPDDPDRFQIVYGRRRVLALRDLGKPVKALLRELDDSALVMAQGQENNARRGLSFIEKANFAAQMRDAGYERHAMCDALAIDKTVVSRMLQIVDRIGTDLITTIGAAPSVGRDRWSALASKLETGEVDAMTMIDMIAAKAHSGSDSNDRFEIAIRTGDDHTPVVKEHTPTDGPPKPRASRRTIMGATSGAPIARAMMGHDKVVLTLPRESGFEDWLVDHLSEIHRTWVQSQADEDPEQ
ncbi:plasmid partitioning protein RepB [uncultured Tateyamaria sp.]|uniref:plasmid partitioning protein RepB n=1 Tax=uncultured Tateyamaria sp. TaxID=455651 RepID=UPI00263416A5|nr:plasmid partitioning protein RepB [uncultured Tateyamaria sp.]